MGRFGQAGFGWFAVGKGFIVRGLQSRFFPVDIVFIKGLRVSTLIGVYAWERTIRQSLIIDLEMATDIRAAARSDAIDDALDYKAVAERIKVFAAQQTFRLVETLAERLSQLLLDEFKLAWLRLRVDKAGALRDGAGVGVVIERGVRS